MTRRSQPEESTVNPYPEKRKPLFVRFAASASFLLLIGILSGCNGSETANGQTAAQAAQKQTDVEWVKQKAKESGGDFNRLNAEDQKRLTAMHGSQAPNVLKGIANPTTDNF